ncbi:forkhead box protein N4-like [Ruditapes philippinarum]|uniref:forkhead box protein N4-like n=1 Tax=Ruditapes philippinarum TaxID=129788 RepID=UPI00295A8755|nr:forkhead box protein N4-like [Ruditapes philippinarum]
MMTAMDFLPSDLEHMNTNFLDMIENEANAQQILDIENLNSDKLNDILNEDLIHDTPSMDFEDDMNNSNWFQSLQWNDTTKVPQSLIDASNEVENNNPNLLVDPQSVLPIHSTPQVQKSNTQQMNQINTCNGIAVKINGQDAVLTPTQHPQIQYVTVQNVVSINNQQVGYTVQPITICPQQNIQNVGTVTSPSLTSPVLVEHLQNGMQLVNNNNNNKVASQQRQPEKVYPKPVYSYSCLIAMALKNSRTGNLPVSEIYNFMIDNFPYFKTAPDGWKNSVRHNLSLNKCFAKAHDGKANGTHTRKGCLWALNPAKIEKMEEEIVKWRKKDPESVKLSMSKPENLELIEQGKAGPPREIDELSTRVKQEPVTPVKQQRQVQTQVVHQQLQPQLICKQEAVVMVKTEPEISVTDVNTFDPSLPNLAMQPGSGMWEEDLTIGVGNPTHPGIVCSSPLVSPTISGSTQYHGNVTYTCTSPQISHSPIHHNLTPSKLYPQTPTKIYPQTPSKLVLA